MNGLADVAVGLWFLPLLVNLILPLAMLAVWVPFRLLFRRKTGRHVARQSVQPGQAGAFSQAQA